MQPSEISRRFSETFKNIVVDLKSFQDTKANNFFMEGKHKNGEVHMFLVYSVLKGNFQLGFTRAEKPHVIAFKFKPGLKSELGYAQ